MSQVLRIAARLPGLNDLIGDAKKSRFTYQATKKKWLDLVGVFIRLHGLEPVDVPVELEFDFYEEGKPGGRRDPDNVGGGGVKIVNDALQLAGILKNDDGRFVKSVRYRVHYNQSRASVAVKISAFKEN